MGFNFLHHPGVVLMQSIYKMRGSASKNVLVVSFYEG